MWLIYVLINIIKHQFESYIPWHRRRTFRSLAAGRECLWGYRPSSHYSSEGPHLDCTATSPPIANTSEKHFKLREQIHPKHCCSYYISHEKKRRNTEAFSRGWPAPRNAAAASNAPASETAPRQAVEDAAKRLVLAAGVALQLLPIHCLVRRQNHQTVNLSLHTSSRRSFNWYYDENML